MTVMERASERALPGAADGRHAESIGYFGSLCTTLMIVDSHPLVRWALAQIVRDRPDIETIGEASTAAEALAIAYNNRPAVATVDCTTDADWALVERLRETYPTMGLVVLTADDSDTMLFRALHAGVSAFVSKAAPIPDVLAAVRHAAVAPQSFSAAGLADALRRKRETAERLALSPREREILHLLRDGLSVPAVAAQLYVSLSTAKTYVARLYDKLGAKNRAQALMTAVRLGLFDEDLRHTG